MDEFELIRRYFDRRNAASGVVVGIGDDGAVLEPTPDKQQVQVIDTLVEGVHFLILVGSMHLLLKSMKVPRLEIK